MIYRMKTSFITSELNDLKGKKIEELKLIIFFNLQGDTVIRFYELLDQSPWSIYLNETCQPLPHTSIAHIPKRFFIK